MGYAGGTKPAPTYHAMGDHTESFQVEFDPEALSYEDLLEMFWTSHDPTHRAWKTQYASLVLASDDQQLQSALESSQRMAEILGRPVATRVEPLSTFWTAEEYHQKYYLRNTPLLMNEFDRFYPQPEDFMNSTAAARVNGYLYGAAGCVRLEQELPTLGLSEASARYLTDVCHR